MKICNKTEWDYMSLERVRDCTKLGSNLSKISRDKHSSDSGIIFRAGCLVSGGAPHDTNVTNDRDTEYCSAQYVALTLACDWWIGFSLADDSVPHPWVLCVIF